MSLPNPVGMVLSLAWRASTALRETGQALERVGCNLQGIYSYYERLSRHMPVRSVRYAAPSIAEDVFVAPSSTVLGAVTIGAKSSIWYNAVIRGDHNHVVIGQNTNIQDGATLTAANEYAPPVVIGDNVSIGHGAIVKGAVIGSHSLIGINAVVSDGAVVYGPSIVAAGSVVGEDEVVPAGEVWAGNPARKLRDLKPAEQEYLEALPQRYVDLASRHAAVTRLLRLKQEEFFA